MFTIDEADEDLLSDNSPIRFDVSPVNGRPPLRA